MEDYHSMDGDCFEDGSCQRFVGLEMWRMFEGVEFLGRYGSDCFESSGSSNVSLYLDLEPDQTACIISVSFVRIFVPVRRVNVVGKIGFKE